MVEDEKFQSIFDELQKIQKIEEQNDIIRSEIKQQSQTIDEIKSETGIEENDKNVIGKGKVPSNLSQNERTRYRNIGQAFIDGAGQTFKRIQNAVKFKENMSTVKEKFFNGLDKIKTGIKNTLGNGDFWKSLMKIIGLLGIIVYLFKDKISSKFPNLSLSLRDIFKQAKGFMGDIAIGVFNYLTTGIGKLFDKIFSSALLVIPTIITTFFDYSLPTAITNLYLEVLGYYGSDSAIKQLEMNSPDSSKAVKDAATALADELETNMNASKEDEEFGENYNKTISALGKHLNENKTPIYEAGAGKEQKFSHLQENAGLVAYEMLGDDINQRQRLKEDLMKLVNESYDNIYHFNGLIQNDHVNMTMFAKTIEEMVADNKLTKQELLRAVIQSTNSSYHREYMQEVLDKMGDEDKVISADFYNDKNSESLRSFISKTRELSNTFIKMEDKSRHLSYQEELEKEKKLMELKRKFKPVVLNIDEHAADLINKRIVGEGATVVSAISNFISGKSLSNAIVEGFNKLKDFYTNFFNRSLDILSNAINVGVSASKWLTVENQAQIQQQVTEENSKTGEKESQVVDNSKISYGDNNVIINIELGNQFNNDTNVISTVLGQITSKEREIAAKINTSNLILGKIIKTVGNIENIEGVTESDVLKIVEEQVKKVDKKSQKRFKDNAIKINKVSNELLDMKNQTQPYVSIVPQQMLGFS